MFDMLGTFSLFVRRDLAELLFGLFEFESTERVCSDNDDSSEGVSSLLLALIDFTTLLLKYFSKELAASLDLVISANFPTDIPRVKIDGCLYINFFIYFKLKFSNKMN